MFQCLDHNVGNNNKATTTSLTRLPHRIQRCHSETEATIMRALQRCKSFSLLNYQVVSSDPTTRLPRTATTLFYCQNLLFTISLLSIIATEEPDLIGDFTRPFALPLTAGKHQDLKCITPQTLVDLIDGKFRNHVEKFTIVDCRLVSKNSFVPVLQLYF